MTTTKYPYLKEILKTTAKVALLAGATVVATPYVFGFAAGFLNLLAAGYVAGGAVAGVGAVATLKTLTKDIITMRTRVQKQQREEKIDNRLETLERKINQMNPKVVEPEQKQPQRVAKYQIDFWKVKRAKDYDRAA